VLFVVLHCLQDNLRIGTRDLDHPISCRCKKHRQLARQEGGFVACFPQAIPMVPSSSIAIPADGKCLTCGGFSLGELVHLGNFKFIADYFGSLSLSPKRSDECAISVGSTHSGPRLRTLPRSTSQHQAGKAASTTFLLDGIAWGPRSPPLQPRHGRKLHPRQDIPCGWRCHG
jgi:hypothetical protein